MVEAAVDEDEDVAVDTGGVVVAEPPVPGDISAADDNDGAKISSMRNKWVRNDDDGRCDQREPASAWKMTRKHEEKKKWGVAEAAKTHEETKRGKDDSDEAFTFSMWLKCDE